MTRIVCHVCGRPTKLRKDGTFYRHDYGGNSASDMCVASGERPGATIAGFAGPYEWREPDDVSNFIVEETS